MPTARPRFAQHLRLRAKLAFLAAAATTAVLASTAYLTIRVFRVHLLQVLSEASSSQSDELRIVLEKQMTASDLTFLRRLVADIGREPSIGWVAVLNPQGRVRISSDPAALDRVIATSSPDCRVCHERPPAERVRSITLPRSGGGVLRTVTPILNKAECHRCHGSAARINGVLIVDRSLAPLERGVISSRAQVIAGSVAAILALLASLGFAVERLVLARLRRLREATRQLGRGNLAARSSDATPDELGELAHDFNAMAEALASALADVRAERRQLAQLVNGIADGVALVDVGLKLVTTNRAFEARLPPGVRPSPGASWADVARAAGFQAADGTSSLAQRALATNRLEKEIVRLARAEGDRVEEIHAQPLLGPEGAATGVIEVWRDISDRMALEAGLEQSERLAQIGMLASGVAHEVGNPLAAIAAAVEGLLRRIDAASGWDPAEVRDYLALVQRQVFRCRDVTERLLGFARLPGRELTTVDAAAAAREALALVARQARVQGVEVRVELAHPVPVLAEPMLLEQVFLNLILNALQCMPGGGVLTIAASAAGEMVSLSVSDTGPGLPEPIRRNLFQPFRSAREGGGGTGLGLFLSQALVRRCDGTLTAESVPGQGAAFVVRLRASADAPARSLA